MKNTEKQLTKKLILGLTTASLYCTGMSMASAIDSNALPQNGVVESGSISIVSGAADKPVMNITQTTDKGIINWGSFNIGSQAAVNFIHTKDNVQNTAGITLNRVAASGGMSEIYGQLNAVGSVILVNPNGVMLGAGGEVNTAGIVMSTADMTSTNFNNGNYIFEQNKNQNNNIIINGSINASTNGDYLTGSNNALAQQLTTLKMNTRQAATGFSMANNKIMLVADGDIAIGNNAKLQATTTTTTSANNTVGTEGFSVEGDSSVRSGSIVLRADQNADDVAAIVKISDSNDNILSLAGVSSDTINQAGKYDKTSSSITTNALNGNDVTAEFKTAKVYLNNTNASQIQSQNVGVYYDANIVNGVNGTNVSDIGISGSSSNTFTQKDYVNGSTEVAGLKNKVTQSGLTTYANASGKAENTKGSGSIENQTYAMLINNTYQLEAIQDTADIATATNETVLQGKSNYYGNLGGVYALGTTISAKDTANWNGGKGFNPIGNGDASSTLAFKGGFTGNGGSNTYGIYDLNINRADEDHVGLFASTANASIWSASLIDSAIKGNDYVGGFVGDAANTNFEGVTMRKRNAAADGVTVATTQEKAANVQGKSYVGGIVGRMVDSSIRYGTNGGYVLSNNISDSTHVGGLAGYASGKKTDKDYTISDSKNLGYYSATENLAYDIYYGVVQGTHTTNVGGLIGNGENVKVTTSYNNGKIVGTTNIGGLVGNASGSSITKSYNTNEATTLGAAVSFVVNPGTGGSVYGSVNGTDNTAGIVGSLTNTTVDTVYNAGNISGYNNVGGIAGKSDGSTISHAYNADNNTVLQTAASGNDYYGFQYGTDKYSYNQANQTWLKNGSTVLTTEAVLQEAPESGRLYNNRLAYKDAVITGATNVGGVVGNASTTTVSQTYNAGKIVGTDAASTGALFGSVASSTSTDNFYVTTQNITNVNLSGVDKAVGTGADTGITAKTLYQAQNLANTTSNGVNWTGTENQNNNWMIYSNSATPLLKAFMTWININRQYEYDGTVHNLVTTDVSNYYGGSFFTDGKGQNVYTEGINAITNYKSDDWVIKTGTKDSETKYSSVYKYDNSNMWSPQHGYYTDKNAAVIITPKAVTATLAGEKTYGEVTKGYLYQDGNKNYWEYNTGTSSWTNKGTSQPEGNYYVLTMTDLADIDKTKVATEVFSNLDKLILTTKAGSTTTNTDGLLYGGSESADQQLDAKTYTLKVTSATGANAVQTLNGNSYDTHNYDVGFTGKLTVKKADLVVNINGERVYGDKNNAAGAQYTYTVAGVNDNANDDLSTTNGLLKTWDKNVSVNVDNGKTNTLASSHIAGLTATTTETIAHNGTTYGSQEILDKTDVKWDSTKNAADSYQLSAVSLANSDKVLSNYNLVFDTNRGEGKISSSSDISSVKITPKNLVYNVTGSNTYGKEDYSYSSAGLQGLASGTDGGTWKDLQSDIALNDVTDEELVNRIGNASRVQANINTNLTQPTHVSRDADGNVINVVTDKAMNISDEGLAISSTNHNYSTLATSLTYKVNPDAITYQVADNTKVYGNTALDNANGGYLLGVDGVTKLDLNSLYSGTKANVTTLGQSDYSIKPDDSSLATIVSDAGFAVKRTDNTQTPEQYTNVIDANKDKFYLNDYVVTTVKKGGVTITPKALTITAGNAEKTYGQDNNNATISASVLAGLISADSSLASAVNTQIKDNIGKYTDTGSYNKATSASVTNETTTFKNYTVTKVDGNLVINRMGLDYKVDDATREYGADNPTFTGSFTNTPTDLDAERISNALNQNSYVLDTTNETSDVGVYNNEIGVKTGSNVGKNYFIATVINGKLNITPANWYYQATPVEYVQGDAGINTATLTGQIVNSQGKNMNSFLSVADKANLTFATDTAVTNASPLGNYGIVGSGVTGTSNYQMAAKPQSLANAYAFRVVSEKPIAPQYNFEVQDMEKFKQNNILPVNYMDGGHIREEGRDAIRFLTIRDTGINLSVAQTANNAITIDASSRIDGGNTVVVQNEKKDKLEISEAKEV